jgi:hypothetical protein
MLGSGFDLRRIQSTDVVLPTEVRIPAIVIAQSGGS